MNMKFFVPKVNIGIVGIIFMLLMAILFIDNESLNSLFIDYNDNLVINEVSVLDVDYSKVIYTNNDSTVTNVSNHSVASSTPTLLSNVAATDYWAWPTDNHYTITTYYGSLHKAIDIYSYTGHGSNIYAANNGVVTMVRGGCVVGDLSCNGRGGNYVVINHNYGNYYTVYMHLKDIRVKEGDTVSRGQVIGTMGNTGNVEPVPTPNAPYLGTHLHFCLYVGQPFAGGYAINPMTVY